MGRPKALLPFDGTPALQLVLDACRGAKLGTPIVVLGKSADAVRAAVQLDSCTVVVNPDPSRGQTSSLKLALRSLPADCEAFLLFPADYPLVTAAEIEPLLSAKSGKQITIPSCNMRRGHPVLIDVAIRAEILRLKDNESLRTVLHRHVNRVHHVNVSSKAVLMDMDTPEDYERCLEAYRRR
jgi:CTP:molybdopterin cytidylyltransferase MocA